MTNPPDPWAQQPGVPQQPNPGGPQYPQQPPYPGGQQQYPGGAMPPASQYPQYPQYPSQPQEQGGQQPRPKSVDLSFKLWMANVILGVVGAVLVFILLDDLIETVANEAGVSAEAAKDAARPLVMAGIFFGLVIIALLAALAFQMRNGKNWARITLTVLAAISLIFGAVRIGDEFAVEGLGPVSGTIGVIRLLLVLGATVLMYMKDANPFFQARQYR